MSATLQTQSASISLANTLRQRRQRLAQQIETPVILWSGSSSPRNFPANVFRFRASSHFLYLAGMPLENAAIHLDDGKLTLFMDDVTPASALWHGEMPARKDIAQQLGADEALPLEALESWVEGAATVAVQDAVTHRQQCQLLHRQVAPSHGSEGIDLALAQAIVSLRLSHDEAALNEIRQAAAVSMVAHQAGMATTLQVQREAEVRAAMEQVIMGHDMTCAYPSIATVQGEVLHNGHYHQPIQPGDLFLADVGAETPGGWASDITRTWPVSGCFSASQRDLYQVVLAAHDRCIEQARPGVEFRELHLLACSAIAQGLVDLGILRGHPDDLVDRDAHALFFPHGLGHLLGLDVHDMEDLGDLAGYAPGRHRSDRFGLGFLRLDRPLQVGMVVTIEPGFYQVPGILQDPERRARYKDVVNWERLAQFSDVRGIRIEDDVLITEEGAEVLSADLPTQPDAIEQYMGSD